MRLPWPIRRLTSRLALNLRARIETDAVGPVYWSLAAAGRHRSGSFEPERMAVLRELLRPGDCFWDIGAHHGYVSLVASRLVGDSGRVHAFEPSAYNLMFLRAHVRWNGLSNVAVHACALGERDGTARFGGEGSSQTQHIGGGTESVVVRSISSLLASGIPQPDVVKIDAEGAEGDILRSGAPHLSSSAALLVSIHSHRAHQESVAALQGRGFLVLESRDVRERRARDDWGMLDPDIVALGPTRHDQAEGIRRIPSFHL